jgi:hypothetical protein
LSLLCKLLCLDDVRILRLLGVSNEEKNQQVSNLVKVDLVPWTVVDA